jgi:ATP-dependent helicase/nuclease subunit B
MLPYRTHLTGLWDYPYMPPSPLRGDRSGRREIVSCAGPGDGYRDLQWSLQSGAYVRLIQVVFAAYDIPYFLDRKLEITNHPLARLILAMLDIFNEQWSYEAVFRYLKTGLTGIDRERIYRLENYVLACGIRGNRWTKDEAWQMSPDFLPDEKDTDKYPQTRAEINAIRKEITGPLLEFRARTKGRKTASAICTALYDFLCTLAVPARIERMVERFRQNGQLDLANEYGQVWNIMMDVLDQTVEVMGEESFGLQRFTDILKIGLAEYQVGLIPASLDQVLVGSVERSRSHEIKALFILAPMTVFFLPPSWKRVFCPTRTGRLWLRQASSWPAIPGLRLLTSNT